MEKKRKTTIAKVAIISGVILASVASVGTVKLVKESKAAIISKYGTAQESARSSTSSVQRITLYGKKGGTSFGSIYIKDGKAYSNSACTTQITTINIPTRTDGVYKFKGIVMSDSTSDKIVDANGKLNMTLLNNRYIANKNDYDAYGIWDEISVQRIKLYDQKGGTFFGSIYMADGKAYKDNACTTEITTIPIPTRTDGNYNFLGMVMADSTSNKIVDANGNLNITLLNNRYIANKNDYDAYGLWEEKSNEVESISLSHSEFSINCIGVNENNGRGYQWQLTAYILPSNAINKNITWSSSNTDIATVDNTGLVRGISPGTAIITATTSNGKTATATAKVVRPSDTWEISKNQDGSMKAYMDGTTLKIQGKGEMKDFDYYEGSEAPWQEKGITKVEIENGVTSIGQYAFDKCSDLTNITIPNSVTTIGEAAFQKCSNLTNITIPKSVTEIGAYAFNECSNLTIEGYKNTEAENYAKANNINFKSLDPIPDFTIDVGGQFAITTRRNKTIKNCSRRFRCNMESCTWIRRLC